MQSDVLLMAAAAQGLFPCPHALGKNSDLNRLALNQFEPREYRIRPAQCSDLPALQQLEEQCWAAALRTPDMVLRQRVTRYPGGQLVLLVQDTVAGVIYSQRIVDKGALHQTTAERVADLHRDDGGIVQLLAVNILPAMQEKNLGDQLLEFMLQRCSLQDAVDAVVAVSLCKNYDRHAGIPIAEYIHARNPQGFLLDPILRFHELHGARIDGAIGDYRPQDINNEGCGVLVSYDLNSRSRNEPPIETRLAGPANMSVSSIRDYLQDTVIGCLGEHRKSAFALDRPLMEMGLDSADLLQMGEKIAHHYRHPLKPAFFFQYNTTEKVITYLAESLVGGTQNNEPPMPETIHSQKPGGALPEQAQDKDIAIIGMACRLPGGINTPEEFWQILKNGETVIGELPAGRWQWPDEIDPQRQHKGIDRGGFLDAVDSFDAPFFRISAKEAESMDPQQRILLELSWQTLEQAGYSAAALANTETGVFIGASGSDYSRLLDQANLPVDAHYGTGGSMAVLANRISYFFDFHGPSLLIDTACSSSLLAVHKAVQSLQSGECSQALVGGINLICHPANSIAYYKAGMLAADGACKTFDQQANGYVRSEGAVLLLLKTLASALSDHDQIHAVIKGTACNHGGQAGGLTVPNPQQQAKLLQTAWQTAGITPQSLSYIETHGTGTSLGDPIEIQGLKEAFAHASAIQPNCGLGSVKTNLGHLEAAAGIAGLLKTVLSLQHRELPAVVHFKRLNEHIPLSGSGFYIVAQHTPWAQGEGPRRAGVSSFGSGGANAHLVVEEYAQICIEKPGVAPGPFVFVLSAKNKPQLLAYAQSYLDWLTAERNQGIVLQDLVYTLQTGRLAMDERLALLISDQQDLIRKLSCFCAQQGKTEQGYQFNIKAIPFELKALTEGDTGVQFIRSVLAQRELDKIALLWTCGFSIDWPAFYSDHTPRRISLPTYPFAKHRYWLPQSDATVSSASVSMRESGVESMPAGAESTVKPTMLASVWRQEAPLNYTGLFPDAGARLLIVGGTPVQCDAIRVVYPDAQVMAIDLQPEALGSQLAALNDLDHIVWIAPDDNADGSLIDAQNHGLLSIFRLLKALSQPAYDTRQLGWTFVTTQTQAVFGQDELQAAHAGVHGLVGSMAKEYPQWRIRLLDMAVNQDWPIRQMFTLPVDEHGEAWAYRGKQWFRRVLVPVRQSSAGQPAYRQNGVYVVIGGAGGIGEAWSRFMVEHYQAQIIWIGRRNKDVEIQAKLDALSEFGPAPMYIAADAADLKALQQAFAVIKQHYPAIHGVIHAAVGLFDDSLAKMPEQRFRTILSAKIDISVHLAQVLQNESMDFMLFFSSIVAFEKNGGLSGYAAGCAFADAFARQLSKQLPFAVKVINWGHWRIGTGDAISAASKKRLQQSGVVAIEPEEAMAALQALLTSPLHQLALIKTRVPEALFMLKADSCLDICVDTIPTSIGAINPVPDDRKNQIDALKPSSIFQNAFMEAQLLPLFAGILQSLGLLDMAMARASDASNAHLAHWLAESQALLKQKAYPQTPAADLQSAWQTWHDAKTGRHRHADTHAAVALVETCLHALPDILAGRQKATDIMFPDASMQLLEGIYRGNSVSDYFNAALGDALVAAIERRLQQDPDAQLRLLEIGAGTGGTTATILPKLLPYRRNIAEYCYTDISKAFLFHAEERYVEHYPFVRTKQFDVEKPPVTQDIDAGRYDMVIAANVLHATRNIRQTLDNTKALLAKHGLLLLNELSDKSLFAHLTFGLLEGWWLAEDDALRIAGSPALYPEAWQRVLQEQGFSAVVFPDPAAQALGQQIIVAESDGIVWQQNAVQKASTLTQADQTQKAPIQEGLTAELLTEKSRFYIRTLIAGVLRMKSDDIDVSEPLETYGIDSILIVQITNKLREVFGDVSRTLLFECQTVAALADYFISHDKASLTRLVGLEPKQAGQDDSSVDWGSPSGHKSMPSEGITQQSKPPKSAIRQKSISQTEPIAVIGISCRFPKADTPDQYWEILKSGRDCIGEIPKDRWPLDGFYHADPDEAVMQGKSYCKWGGFLDKVTDFDPMFFNISPKEAITIDPQERLFLQTAWEALEDAGYTREHLLKKFRQKVGVFAGITRTGFDLFGPDLWRRGETIQPHTSFSSAANRLSYFLNLRGPSVPVDTMCSSSLTAIHQACQHLRHEECEMAFAGGVNLYLHPSGYVGLSASRMLSKDGRCKSFGKGGNGFVPGEGVGVVLLKPLSRAIADGDHIYACIRASHINHGGKTNGYTVPNPQAQAELIRESLQKAGVDARTMTYIEAHGTGTELGDPIEITGLTQAFQKDTTDTGFCALGSVKANVGHLEAAAGIAGFIKVILQMRHGQLAPSLHAAETNPNIDFDKTPFVVQQTLAEWRRPVLDSNGVAQQYPRRAGVSSFGAGGVNADVILEEYPEQQALPAGRDEVCLIVLSAKSDDRLKAYTGVLHDFVRKHAELDLADLAYTLQVGREAMDERLALTVRSIGELQDKLNGFIEGRDDIADLYRGQAHRHKELLAVFANDAAMEQTLATWMEQRHYSKLLNLWAKGWAIDWQRLYDVQLNNKPGCRAPKRISLPTYPFAGKPYWLPDAAPQTAAPIINETPALPLEQDRNAIVKPVITSKPAAADKPDVVAAKPAGATLAALSTFSGVFQHQAATAKRKLTPLHYFDDTGDSGKEAQIPHQQARVELREYGQGVFAVNLHYSGNSALSAGSVCDGLTQSFDELRALAESAAGIDEAPKVLLLTGLEQLCLCGDEKAAEIFINKHIPGLIADCNIPVIAVLKERNTTIGWLLASLCDLMLCSEEGFYRYHDTAVSDEEYRLFVERFGEKNSLMLLSSTTSHTGRELKEKGLSLLVVPEAGLDHAALDMAYTIAQAPRCALVELKRHLAARLSGLAQQLSRRTPLPEHSLKHHDNRRQDAWAALFTAEKHDDVADPGTPEKIGLASDVVTVKAYKNGIVLVTLCNKTGKNTFSPAFVNGVLEAFEHIRNTPDYKVVVLTGYDHYFACGGTKEGLLAIQNGSARFTDEQSYSAPLACDIPVIAAMQGHAIGAGWAMGLFCDAAIYSEESRYQSPYMLYGFTPGAGSTLIFPHRLGYDLSREILFTANTYQGKALKQRGINMPVMPRSEVLAYALDLAHRVALSPRGILVEQKRQRVQVLRNQLDDIFKQELAMHDKTFVGSRDVIDKIQRHFNDVVDLHEGGAGEALQTPDSGKVLQQTSASILETLRKTLADELTMPLETVNDDMTFIDMGMDSITAVTWIRKLNKHYDLALEATQVYRTPTLTAFAGYLLKARPVAAAEEPVAESAAILLAVLRESLAAELYLQAETLDEDMKFIDMGMDSITAVTWIRKINKRYGLSIGATKVYSYPTLREFYRYVLKEAKPGLLCVADIKQSAAPVAMTPEPALPAGQFKIVRAYELSGARRQVVAEPEPHNSAPQHDDKAIAIIGMAGQFPKAKNLQQFWDNLVQGRDCISEIPPERWNIEDFYSPDRQTPGKTVCRHMGVLDDVDVFDPLFFNISPYEAELMDPQQRLFLQACWQCIEDAGYNPQVLSGSQCGVFAGCAAGDYAQLLDGQMLSAQALMGESVSILPARIAYFLNLQGPSLALDTACSSSLVAIANACDSLLLGNSELALAGGVYVITGPDIHVKMSQFGMLSPDGRCFSFDQRANGFVPGEGVGVLLLKRLQQAEQDGDAIYGVIRGWGVNQDGKTNGITAPNPDSQTRLEKQVYQRFGINPEHIQLVEAHGTGTQLGDPIEVDALTETFKHFTDKQNYCALGSVKSNIGHLATAAGVSGVIKALLALRHRQLPPTINYQTLNEHIRLQDSPFYVNTDCKDWPAPEGQKRLAAVSSFGFSGTNAHIVLEGYQQKIATPSAAPVMFVLSAKTGPQLRQYADNVRTYLAGAFKNSGLALADLAYTYQTGREAMPVRLAIIADGVDDLINKLACHTEDPDCFTGVADKCISPAAGSDKNLKEVARRWVDGEAIDWSSFYKSEHRQRLHGLPGYPFVGERYWVPEVTRCRARRARLEVPERLGNIRRALRKSIPVGGATEEGGWLAEEVPETVCWNDRLKQYQDVGITVLYADETEKETFCNLVKQLEQAAGLPKPLNLRLLNASDTSPELFKSMPDVLLFLATDEKIQAAAALLAKASKPVRVFCLIETGVKTAIKRNDTHYWTQITRAGLNETVSSVQILLKEWLARDFPEQHPAAWTEIRYQASQRLVRQPVAARYLIEKSWKAQPLNTADRPAGNAAIVILANRDSVKLARQLMTFAGFNNSLLIADNDIDFNDAESSRARANQLLTQLSDISLLIDLSDLYATAKDEADDCLGKISFYQTVVGACTDIGILYFTKGLQYFQSASVSLAGAKFAGLVKMLSAEYPHVNAKFIDIDQSAYEDAKQFHDIVNREYAAELAETELCYRQGQRFAPYLHINPQPTNRPFSISKEGVYVISGGTNGVGLEIAKHLASKGCKNLVLMGIKPLPPKDGWETAVQNNELSPYISNKLIELIKLDKAVLNLHIYTGPLTEQSQLETYFNHIRSTLGPIKGVIHSAGVYSDLEKPGFASKDLLHIQQVFEPKVKGLETLHAVFKNDEPDFFVSFSSLTGVIPRLARGAGDYATANAFVDFFSAYQGRHNSNTVYKTVTWSDWNETGAITRVCADRVDLIDSNFRQLGLRTFSNREGCLLFEHAMAAGDSGWVFPAYLDMPRFNEAMPQLLFARLTLPKMVGRVEDSVVKKLLAQLARWESEKQSGLEIPVSHITDVVSFDEIKRLEPALIHRIHQLLFAKDGGEAKQGAPIKNEALPCCEQEPADISGIIAKTLAEVLKLNDIDQRQPFQNYGLDSISAMVMATRLEKKLQQAVQPRWLIDFSTVETLSRHLMTINN